MIETVKKLIKWPLNALNLDLVRTDRPAVFSETDKSFLDLYLYAQKKTQMTATDNRLRRERHYILMQLVRQVMQAIGDADVAECGCWRGLSAYQIAHCLQDAGFKNRFYIFDSFEGLSDFAKEDRENNNVRNETARRKEFACSLDDVKANLAEFDFIEFHKAWIPGGFSAAADRKFALVNIDVDLYQPIRNSLEFFYPRMARSGIIALDDYGCASFPGARRAVDEFIKDKNDFFLATPCGEAFIIKR